MRHDESSVTPSRSAFIKSLSITRGSLTTSEIDEIRSHVVHTKSFLSQIPWGRAFRRIPEIAGCHHEKLNGSGYPNRLKAQEIPLQSKLMSISDIFDALTASDRPYKPAKTLSQSLEIRKKMAEEGHIDRELFRIFLDSGVGQRYAERFLAPAQRDTSAGDAFMPRP